MSEAPKPPPADADLPALCAAAAAGQPEAFERLILLHHPRLLGLARRKVGVDWQGKIDPEDILQEAYAAAFPTISKFEYRGEDSFFHWLSRIVDQRFIDKVRGLRRAKRDATREVTTSAATHASRYDGLLERLSHHGPRPSQVARREDAIAGMLAALSSLPEDYRIVIQRVYLDEEPIADVARDLGRTEDALRRLAGRALDKLHEGMGRVSRWLSRAP